MGSGGDVTHILATHDMLVKASLHVCDIRVQGVVYYKEYWLQVYGRPKPVWASNVPVGVKFFVASPSSRSRSRVRSDRMLDPLSVCCRRFEHV